MASQPVCSGRSGPSRPSGHCDDFYFCAWTHHGANSRHRAHYLRFYLCYPIAATLARPTIRCPTPTKVASFFARCFRQQRSPPRIGCSVCSSCQRVCPSRRGRKSWWARTRVPAERGYGVARQPGCSTIRIRVDGVPLPVAKMCFILKMLVM